MEYFGLHIFLIVLIAIYFTVPNAETKISAIYSEKMKEEKSIYHGKNGPQRVKKSENFTIDFVTITPDNDLDIYKSSNVKRKTIFEPRNVDISRGFFISLQRGPKKLSQDLNAIGQKIDRVFHKRQEGKVWDQWSAWSECSVTCGVGRSVRWRRCLSSGCETEEKEAQLKLCSSTGC